MRSVLISLVSLTVFVPALAVESSTFLVFEKKGSIWHCENKPFSDCRKVRRSALCKDIASKVKLDEIESFSTNLFNFLATINSSNALVSDLNGVNPSVAKALECARILLRLTDASAMNSYLDANPTDEHELLKHAYWLGWGHFKEFAAEVDHELNFESLTLVLDVIENDTEGSIVEIPTSSCSRESLFFLIGLKSAADLESKLSEFDAQRQFEIFKCANYTN